MAEIDTTGLTNLTPWGDFENMDYYRHVKNINAASRFGSAYKGKQCATIGGSEKYSGSFTVENVNVNDKLLVDFQLSSYQKSGSVVVTSGQGYAGPYQTTADKWQHVQATVYATAGTTTITFNCTCKGYAIIKIDDLKVYDLSKKDTDPDKPVKPVDPDQPVKTDTIKALFTSLGESVRHYSGKTGSMSLSDMVTATGGGTESDYDTALQALGTNARKVNGSSGQMTIQDIIKVFNDHNINPLITAFSGSCDTSPFNGGVHTNFMTLNTSLENNPYRIWVNLDNCKGTLSKAEVGYDSLHGLPLSVDTHTNDMYFLKGIIKNVSDNSVAFEFDGLTQATITKIYLQKI